MKSLKVLSLVFSFLFAQNVFAQVNRGGPRPVSPEEQMRPGNGGSPSNGGSAYSPLVNIKDPKYSGNGCPPGTASISLSPDNKMISILLDQFIVQAGGPNARPVDRKRCQVSIPFEIPAGMQVSLLRVDYRGFNSIPDSRSFTELITNHQFFRVRNATIGQNVSKKHYFSGPLNEEFFLSGDAGSQIFSPCGERVVLNILTMMSATASSAQSEILSTVDSIDSESETNIKYHLMWRQCR